MAIRNHYRVAIVMLAVCLTPHAADASLFDISKLRMNASQLTLQREQCVDGCTMQLHLFDPAVFANAPHASCSSCGSLTGLSYECDGFYSSVIIGSNLMGHVSQPKDINGQTFADANLIGSGVTPLKQHIVELGQRVTDTYCTTATGSSLDGAYLEVANFNLRDEFHGPFEFLFRRSQQLRGAAETVQGQMAGFYSMPEGERAWAIVNEALVLGEPDPSVQESLEYLGYLCLNWALDDLGASNGFSAAGIPTLNPSQWEEVELLRNLPPFCQWIDSCLSPVESATWGRIKRHYRD